MGNFLRGTAFETTFDGDTVKARIKPIKQGDSLRLFAMRDKDGKMQNEALLPIFADMVPVYVELETGPRAADGSEVTMTEIVRHSYFTALLVELGVALMKTGVLVNPKAPASQPEAISQG